MVDLERSSKLKAHHELLPLASRLRLRETIFGTGDRDSVHKKKEKNRGYSVRVMGAGSLTKTASQERVSWEDKPAWTCEEGESFRSSTPASASN